MKNRVLIKVMGGIGDVLLILPSIKKLNLKYDIDILLRNHNKSDIEDFTYDICKHNPYINKFVEHQEYVYLPNKKYDKVLMSASFYLDQDVTLINPKPRYELVAEQLHVSDVNPLDIDIFLQHDEEQKAKETLSKYNKTILIQACRLRENFTNEGKTIPKYAWEDIIQAFPDYTFIQVGTSKDSIPLDNVVSLVDKTTIRESIALLKFVDYYILPDSYLNHAAGGMNKNGISIFGSTSPYVYGYSCSKNFWFGPNCSPCRIQDPNIMYDQKPCCMREKGIPVNTEKIIQVMTEEL